MSADFYSLFLCFNKCHFPKTWHPSATRINSKFSILLSFCLHLRLYDAVWFYMRHWFGFQVYWCLRPQSTFYSNCWLHLSLTAIIQKYHISFRLNLLPLILLSFFRIIFSFISNVFMMMMCCVMEKIINQADTNIDNKYVLK